MACHGSGLADEGGSHLEKSGRDITDGSLHIVDEPVNEVKEFLFWMANRGKWQQLQETIKYYFTSN